MNLPTGVTKIEGFVADPEALFVQMEETYLSRAYSLRGTAEPLGRTLR